MIPNVFNIEFLGTKLVLFFVISGFVFARTILSNKIDIGSFLIRRFFRLYPLYFVSLIIYFVLIGSYQYKVDYFINHLLFLHTTNSIEESAFFNPAYWTLPIEVEFYCLIPFLVYLTRFKGALVLIFIFSISIKLFLSFHSTGAIDMYAFLSVHLTGRLPEFLVGVFLYKFYIFTGSKSYTFKLNLIFCITLLGFLSMYIMFYTDIFSSKEGLGNYNFVLGLHGFLYALCYACILFPLLFISPQNVHGLVHKLSIYIGSISYSVYLIHNAIPRIFILAEIDINGATLFLSCVLITLILSTILHRYVEDPMRVFGLKVVSKLPRSQN